MQTERYEVEKERFHLIDKRIYLLEGTFPKEYRAEAYLDRKLLSVEIREKDLAESQDFQNLDTRSACKIEMQVRLPEQLETAGKLKIFAVKGEQKFLWFSASARQLARRQGMPQYFLEEVQVDAKAHTCKIRGWCAYREPLLVRVEDENRKPVACSIERTARVDVKNQYPEVSLEEKPGFYLEVSNVKAKRLQLIFEAQGVRTIRGISQQPMVIAGEKAGVYYNKGMRYLKLHGLRAVTEKVLTKLQGRRSAPAPYDKWLLHHLPDKAELKAQQKEHFAWEPKISVVVPLYKTPLRYLLRLVESLQQQTYANWELCLSDGSGRNTPLRDTLERLMREEKRIRVVYHEEALQISENTNAAIHMATGNYIAFADHDDELTPHALYECVKALNRDNTIEILYSDEDKMTMDGNKFFQPHMKPDFNRELLCTVNYICHLFVVKRELMEKVGLLRPEFDGAQDYDFILRCTEQSKHIYHIPKILYHWRCHEDSTAENPESKLYAFDMGAKAVQAHYDRVGIPAKVTRGEYLGLYRTEFLFEEQPLISIIIPNKDHIDDLKRCMDSIEQKSTYRNYEYIIVENNSTEEKTFAYYKQLEAENKKVKVVYWNGIFNYSEINNFGIQYAKGEYLLLLNNDTEIINPDCLKELLGYCMCPQVGAVGARLYYEDDTIQHAGVVIGFGGIAGHCFVQQKRSATGYCHRIICAQDYSAVTAACMMVRRSAFEEVGGLSPELQVAFNDIDFCMKLRKAGYLIVYNPYAELYHYESKSRGLEDTPEKIARFNREIAIFQKRWPEILKNGDPYYSPNLTLESQDFSLRRI